VFVRYGWVNSDFCHGSTAVIQIRSNECQNDSLVRIKIKVNFIIIFILVIFDHWEYLVMQL